VAGLQIADGLDERRFLFDRVQRDPARDLDLFHERNSQFRK